MPAYDAVLFDCDGVLVDSEPITNAVLSEMLGELGWSVTAQECAARFTGRGVLEDRALVEARIGRSLPDEWAGQFRARRNAQLQLHLQPIAHAMETIVKIHARYDDRIAVVSGAHRSKVILQLEKCGMLQYFDSRIFSGQECLRSKPYPDVYLAAAAALAVSPSACLVVEDTSHGVAAGVSAGATVIGYSPSEAGDIAARALIDSGASRVISDLRELISFV